MKTVVFKVQTVTPTFMGGGEGRFDGIRIPEIKGVMRMRWWFRALAGCFVGDDLSRLKDIEGNIFGIANDSKNNQKSKFRLSIENSKWNCNNFSRPFKVLCQSGNIKQMYGGLT